MWSTNLIYFISKLAINSNVFIYQELVNYRHSIVVKQLQVAFGDLQCYV